MNRKEILDIINKVLSDEQDTIPIDEENFLYESNLDSLGYAIFWIGLNTELVSIYKLSSPLLIPEYIDSLDMMTYKVSDLITAIEDKVIEIC